MVELHELIERTDETAESQSWPAGVLHVALSEAVENSQVQHDLRQHSSKTSPLLDVSSHNANHKQHVAMACRHCAVVHASSASMLTPACPAQAPCHPYPKWQLSARLHPWPAAYVLYSIESAVTESRSRLAPES
jgi:hypothetical protein